jgi:protease I
MDHLADKVSGQISLEGMRIAMLCTDGVEQTELYKPREALEAAGAEVALVSPKDSFVETWKHFEKSDKVDVDVRLNEADAEDFDALVLPGGVASPDQLRMNPAAVSFVKAFIQADKPIAAICHGPWTLIEAGGVRGKEMTSWPSLKTDLTNAGAKWSDEKVVVSTNLVTSRKPDDIPDFNSEMIKMFGSCLQSVSQGIGSKTIQSDTSAAPSAQI